MRKFLILTRKEIKELLTPQMLAPIIIIMVIFAFIGNILSNEAKKEEIQPKVLVVDEDKTSVSTEAISVLSGLKLDVQKASTFDQAQEESKRLDIASILIIPSGFGSGIDNFKPQKVSLYTSVNNLSVAGSSKNTKASGVIASLNSYFSNKWMSQLQSRVPTDTLNSSVVVDQYSFIGDKRAHVSYSELWDIFSREQPLSRLSYSL
jgi:ABC-type Na+ efflux pump permease subunit